MKGIYKKLTAIAAVTISLLAVLVIQASACTTIYTGANLMAEGTPFVARTEDYGQNMNKMWFISETGAYAKGSQFRGCPAYGPFSYTFSHDSYRFTFFTNDIFTEGCPECGEVNPTHYSYTEFGTNEKGVSVSATETLYGNSQVSAVDPFHTSKWSAANNNAPIGIEETDIPTIILAEAASAREGIELLAHIYDTYGCVYASGLFICDQNEVWYIENCSGTQYVALKLNNDMMFLEPNMAVIGRVDLDDENVIASDRLIEVAKTAGTFVGNEAANIIDFRASYSARLDRVDARLVEGLNYINSTYNYTSADLIADNTLFTITNLNDKGEITALHTNITADRQLTKDDVFNYYNLSTIGKPGNQEIEIFQLFKDRSVEFGTVGWVAVGNMSYNVFVPCFPMLLDDTYAAYQVSTPVVTKSTEKPDTFCTYQSNKFVVYPENWKDSYYFCFEGLGGYIQYAEQISGKALTAEQKAYVQGQLKTLQKSFYEQFVTEKMVAYSADPRACATQNAMDMAEQAHKTALKLIDYVVAATTSEDEVPMDPNLAVAPVDPFDDVDPAEYYITPMLWAYRNQIVAGTSETTFSPDDSCTRGQLITMLWRLVGSPVASDKAVMPFSDVTEADYYYAAVLWAAENGITAGMGNGLFAPDSEVTRAQVVTFLYQIAGHPDAKGENPFSDVAEGCWYTKPITWAAGEGVVAGIGDGLFAPEDVCTRAMIVTMLYAAVQD